MNRDVSYKFSSENNTIEVSISNYETICFYKKIFEIRLENSKPFARTIYFKNESEKKPEIVDGCVFKKKDDSFLKSVYENLIKSTQWSEVLDYSLRMQIYKNLISSVIEFKKIIRTEFMKTEDYIENVKSLCLRCKIRLALKEEGFGFESVNHPDQDANLLNQELELLDKQFGRLYSRNMAAYVGYKEEVSKFIEL